MPYNTRRKSLSLPSLGIHVPVTLAERAAAAQHRASAAAAAAAAAARETSPASMASPTPSREQATHPSKKLKRAHTHDDDDDEPSRSAPQAKRRDDSMKYTPPPSPPAHRSSIESDDEEPSGEIDLDSINDDIVEAVVVQLQETGNRPHLVKELTAVLMQSLKVVQQYVYQPPPFPSLPLHPPPLLYYQHRFLPYRCPTFRLLSSSLALTFPATPPGPRTLAPSSPPGYQPT